MVLSQNGYSANNREYMKTYNIAGELVSLRDDDCGALLAFVALWVHNNVESISKGHQRDDWGYAERPIRGSTTTLSNHASGTALDFNATQHPLGVKGTWSRKEKRKINRYLRNQVEGVVRWGENYSGRVDGMHFEIDEDYNEVRKVLHKLVVGEKKKVRRRPTINLTNVAREFRKGGTRSLPGVKVVQRELNQKGYGNLKVDGWAGAQTKAAYYRFERANRTPRADGIPGWFSIRVLGGIIPGRKRFNVVRKGK